MDIKIDEPVSIRGYISGGMGGWGSSTTSLHRLVRRRSDADVAACGATFRGKISVKPAGRDGRPPKAEAEKYGLCDICWGDRPTAAEQAMAARDRARDDEAEHAKGHHDEVQLDGCPECALRRNRTR